MKFLIVTHTPHIVSNDLVYAYAAYVREMDVWNQYATKVSVVAPQINQSPSNIHLAYSKKQLSIRKIPAMAFINFKWVIKTLFNLPLIIWVLFTEMKKADHIHLRCPGTIGLMGCVVQLLFPKKKKTAKYAGNWDPKAVQPLSYRIQKWILSKTFLTRNMRVLVYGDWPHQSANIVPFFTATYQACDIKQTNKPLFNEPYKFLFVGALSPGKNPLYAIKIVEQLLKKEIIAQLDIYGEGVERPLIARYIKEHNLESAISLHGNQNAKTIENAYKESHFLILASQSEGWPKVVAEAMFWGAIPLVTQVSCVPWMIDYEKRGAFLSLHIDKDVKKINTLLLQKDTLQTMSLHAQQWSQQFTLDKFSEKINTFL